MSTAWFSPAPRNPMASGLNIIHSAVFLRNLNIMFSPRAQFYVVPLRSLCSTFSKNQSPRVLTGVGVGCVRTFSGTLYSNSIRSKREVGKEFIEAGDRSDKELL